MEIYGVELEVWIGAGAAILALGVWGLKRYQTVMADGKITLDEIISGLEDGEKLVDKAVEATEEAHDKFVEAKKRKCSICGVSGHDKRNCPTLEDE